ncbi:MAG: hypothetical protein HC866_17365 [Leptolyngbyaceae cyanobacterium RU_5_1]|nr:hypothetical protein [Leptolyngbyaceae cyanobacterium RU_5_1]
MQRSSEFPLFCQTAIAIFGFLLLISLVSGFSTSKSILHTASAASAEIAK